MVRFAANFIDEFERLKHEMNEILNNRYTTYYNRNSYPFTNIYKTEDGFKLVALLPGVESDSIEITYEKGNLTLQGNKQSDEETNKNYIRFEREYGKFSKTFYVGDDIDSETIQAEYKNGILEIDLKKLPEAKPKTIKVV